MTEYEFQLEISETTAGICDSLPSHRDFSV